MLFETRLLTLLALNDALVPRLRNEQKKKCEKKVLIGEKFYIYINIYYLRWIVDDELSRKEEEEKSCSVDWWYNSVSFARR